MKLFRSMLYITVGVAAGLLLKRFLTDERAESEPAAPTVASPPKSAQDAPAKPQPVAQPKEDTAGELIPVMEADPEPAAPSAKDDLTRINGIGPTYAKRLNEAGIYTFAALATQPVEKIREITQLKEWQAADPADWIAEADSLATNGGDA